MTSERKKLSVVFTRPLLPDEDGTVTVRALASLGGVADEVVTSDVHPHFPSCPEATAVQGATVTTLSFGNETPDHNLFVPDMPSSFSNVLQTRFTGMLLPRQLSALVNVTSSCASGEYVLLLDPAEVCLDPVNLVRTLTFLDDNPHVDVVSLEVKIYDGDEHARTVMRPKILRRGKVFSMGILADDAEPTTPVNHLVAASGLTFRDTSGASKERGMFELKILLARYFKGTKSAPAPLVADVARRLVEHSASGAVVVLGDFLSHFQGLRQKTALPLRLLGRARMKSPSYSSDSAMEAYDASLRVEETAEGYLWRGLDAFDDKSLKRPYLSDLSRAVEIGEPSNFYGLDLREVRRAKQILATYSYEPPKTEPVGNILDYVVKVDAPGSFEVQGSRDGENFTRLEQTDARYPNPAETQGGVTREEFDETLSQANLPDSDPRKRD